MTEGWLRARRVLERRFAVIVVGLLVLAALGGWVTYGAHVAPATTTEQRTVETGRVGGAFDHGARVTAAANGTGFDPGSRVENRSVYFSRVMPVLDGSAAVAYDGASGARVRVTRRVEVQSVSTTGDESATVYWNRTLSSETRTETLRSGGQVRVPFSVDVPRVTREARNVSERLGSPGQIRLLVVADVVVERARGPARAISFDMTIQPGTGVYRVESSRQVETFTRTETVTRRVEPGALRALGGPLLTLVCLADVAGLVYARRAGALGLSAHERAWLDYRDDRDDFDEWITTVRLPEEARDLPVAEAETLADLVDFAIDTDNAVLASPGERTFHVVHGGYRYTYVAPRPPESAGAPEGRPSVSEAVEEPDGAESVDLEPSVDADSRE